MSEKPLRLVCGNCGKIERFESFEEAHQLGWDTILHFGYNACENCLGVSVYFPMWYAQQARAATNPEERQELIELAIKATTEYERS
jgi:hypothetical protein